MSASVLPFTNPSAEERDRLREEELRRRRDERERRIDAQVERVVQEVRDLGNLVKEKEGEEHSAS
jgi:hypothetical protein